MTSSADDIWRMVQEGSGIQTALVSDEPVAEALAETLTAMANTLGGLLLVGVDAHERRIIGVTNPEAIIDVILQAAILIDPKLILPLPQVVQMEGKSVIVTQVPRGMPFIYNLTGRYLRRTEAENIPLRPTELHRLMVERSESSFETEAVRGAGFTDLDWEKARSYAASLTGMGSATIEDILLKRGCLTEVDGALRPTHAGVLLFGKDPQRFIRGADITAARFASDSLSDSFTRQDIGGALPDQIRRAEMFLVDHLRKDVHLGATMMRTESFEFPMEAARELVVNAVAHRDYRINGDGIRLFLFKNRMEVTSPGRLPGPVTIDNIKDERFSRNPAIVQVLSDMGFIERLGYGVDRVIDLMRQHRLEAPRFEETSGGFRVTLINTEAPATVPEHPAPQAAPALNGFFRGVEINPRQEAALLYLQRGSSRITNGDLQALRPDVHPETIRRDLADLVTKGILAKMGQKRGSYYVLRQEGEPAFTGAGGQQGDNGE